MRLLPLDGAGDVARRMAPILVFLVALLGTLTTVLLALDTTAVLLTPVVLFTGRSAEPAADAVRAVDGVARQHGQPAAAGVDPSNLLALHKFGLSTGAFAARMWLPLLVAVALTVLLIDVRHHRVLHSRYDVPDRPVVGDRVLLVASGVACLGLVPALLLGADPPGR